MEFDKDLLFYIVWYKGNFAKFPSFSKKISEKSKGSDILPVPDILLYLTRVKYTYII